MAHICSGVNSSTLSLRLWLICTLEWVTYLFFWRLSITLLYALDTFRLSISWWTSERMFLVWFFRWNSSADCWVTIGWSSVLEVAVGLLFVLCLHSLFWSCMVYAFSAIFGFFSGILWKVTLFTSTLAMLSLRPMICSLFWWTRNEFREPFNRRFSSFNWRWYELNCAAESFNLATTSLMTAWLLSCLSKCFLYSPILRSGYFYEFETCCRFGIVFFICLNSGQREALAKVRVWCRKVSACRRTLSSLGDSDASSRCSWSCFGWNSMMESSA